MPVQCTWLYFHLTSRPAIWTSPVVSTYYLLKYLIIYIKGANDGTCYVFGPVSNPEPKFYENKEFCVDRNLIMPEPTSDLQREALRELIHANNIKSVWLGFTNGANCLNKDTELDV